MNKENIKQLENVYRGTYLKKWNPKILEVKRTLNAKNYRDARILKKMKIINCKLLECI